MQVLAINSRVVLRPTVRMKIKRRLKEAVKLIVTRGAAVEESRKGPKVIFRAEDVGADKWIAPGVLLLLFFHAPNVLSFFRWYYSRWAFMQIGRMLLCPHRRCSACRLRNCYIQCVKHSCFFIGAFPKLRGF